MTSPAAPPPDADRPKFWFPAKTHGWGWGWPCAWQGWLVLAVYLVLLPVAVWMFPPERTLPGFVASVLGLSAMLLAICLVEGRASEMALGIGDAGLLPPEICMRFFMNQTCEEP